MYQEIRSFSPGSGDRVRPRGHIATDAASMDLSGTWRFRYSARPDLAPEGASDVDHDDADWDDIVLPCHWVLQGRDDWGRPAYTNVQYPFPVEVPDVPDENPTGDHRLTFELPEGFVPDGGRVFLRFGGVESLCIASLNGIRVGVVRGSRLAQELDVTAQLQPGTNVMHLRVHQWSAHSYLEDQDQWWLPGVFREVELLARPAAGIDDVWLRADFDPETGEGLLIPELVADAAAFPITVALPGLGVAATYASPEEVEALPVGEVDPWSADRPTLYEAEVTNAAETRTLRVGFRRVEIVGHEWLVNGTKLRIRGVNRHEFDPDHGRVFDREKAREGLLLMKQHNINAVRTAHYPPHPEFLELTDELGFWVIDECDLETHGFVFDDWQSNPTDDVRWRDALLDRVERFFERDKNHASVICWSLGNEAGTGSNSAAMAAWLNRRDPERPVHYEPDHDGTHTDLVSRMYATVEEMADMSQGTGAPEEGAPGRNAVLAGRPMILCEYAHAMGNGAGGLSVYEEAFDTLPQWHGGFVWEWRDHGLRHTTSGGQEFNAYGGDFGEQVHDGSFVCDGMVLSDGTPTPMLAEFAAVASPIKLDVWENAMLVENRRHDGDTTDLRFVVVDEHDGRVVSEVEVDLLPVGPAGDSGIVELPDAAQPEAGQAWRTVRAELARDTAWAKRGHVVAFAQVQTHTVVESRTAKPAGEAPAIGGSGRITLGPAVFDARTGDLTSLREVALEGPRLDLWRAPTENDVLGDFPSYVDVEPAASRGAGAPGPSSADQWREAGLDRLQRRVLAVDVRQDGVRVLHRFAPAASQQSVLLELFWQMRDGELVLSADAQPSRGWKGTWPRIGLHFLLPTGLGHVEWFGTGPNESYPDSKQAAVVGRFGGDVEDLVVNYAVPQESGHRGGLRELSLPDLPLLLRADEVNGERPGFQLRAHSAHEVAAAAHPHELPTSTATHLLIDAAVHGLGSRSCGPDVRPEYQLRPRAAQWSLRFTAE
ncbi:glycoside hydrolase family 2 TIM barrel-domain containing protein [Tessaracoccus antarcticus]|uniref:glycoside hydrolase family 2 TIM barrel-domain containing protein n=1 Tax=Tessaracoccus antarcticus TaxID=2479848 RepID=UPI001F308FCB|nr:glycoside hydrolase family 2 TIM barrel-domain containing protein [Tessaracoccus antarcticus]